MTRNRVTLASRHRRTARLLVAGAIATVTAVTLVACTSSASTSASSGSASSSSSDSGGGGRTKLVLWEFDNGPDTPSMTKIINAFNSSQSKYQVVDTNINYQTWARRSW